MKKNLILFLVFFICLNIFLDQYYKNKFKKENFPPNIIFDLKEDIELPNVEEGLEIPKNIYRCYKDLEGISKFRKVFNLTEERMPDYKQIYYTDELIDKYIKENYSERIYNAYNSINPSYGAARADFFRYLIIYKEGGIYMDIKTGPNKKINNFFEKYQNKLLVSVGMNTLPHFVPKHHLKTTFNFNDDWNFVTGVNGSEYQQFVIASNKGNPILGKIIQQVVSNIEEGLKNKQYYNSGNYSVVAMTGPITYSLVIEKYKKLYKGNVEFFSCGYQRRIDHSLIDYKKIMLDKHYSKIKNKQILI